MRTAWVIEPQDDPIARWTTDPFRYHWPQLLATRRLVVRFLRARDLAETGELLDRARCDVVFVATGWRECMEQTLRTFAAFSRKKSRPKLAFLDTTDPTSSPFFALLPYVDVMVKKQLLSPVGRYREVLHGSHVLADYFVRQHGFQLGNWHFGSRLPESLEHKLMLGWNLGSARELARGLLASYLTLSPRAGISVRWTSTTALD